MTLCNSEMFQPRITDIYVSYEYLERMELEKRNANAAAAAALSLEMWGCSLELEVLARTCV